MTCVGAVGQGGTGRSWAVDTTHSLFVDTFTVVWLSAAPQSADHHTTGKEFVEREVQCPLPTLPAVVR